MRLARHVGPMLTVLAAYDVLVTVLYVKLGWRWIGINELPLPLLGSALVLVVTLRNNAAYARWWEARGLWGSVVNNARSLMRGLALYAVDPGLQERLVRLQIGYVLALRCHLLRQPPWEAASIYVEAGALPRLKAATNAPVAIQMEMARLMAGSGLDSVALAALNDTMSALMDAQGGLERIKNTPLPMHYLQFPLVFSRAYCLLLPLGLLGDLGIVTPIGSTLIGFMFLALDRIGQDLQDPFEGTVHDVPMRAIARTIEIDLLQGIGAAGVPGAVVPENGVLA